MAEQPDQTGEAAARQPQAMANRMFPVPPYYYKAFTDSAWKAHKSAKQAVDQQRDGEGNETETTPSDVLAGEAVWNPFAASDRDDLSNKTGILFEPPRADWVIESDYFESFGQSHQVSSRSIEQVFNPAENSVFLFVAASQTC